MSSIHLLTSVSEYIEMSRCQQRTDSYLLHNNNKHTRSVWHTVCRVVLQLERHFLPINPRACLYNRIWYKAMKQDSLVHVNSWKSSAVLCHLIKEELIMLSLTNIGRPYGAWRFSGSTRDADKNSLVGGGEGNLPLWRSTVPTYTLPFVCGFFSATWYANDVFVTMWRECRALPELDRSRWWVNAYCFSRQFPSD